MTVLERDEQVAEWMRLSAKVAQLGQPSGGAQPAENGISKAARELNISRQDAERAEKVDSLTPEAKEAAREANSRLNLELRRSTPACRRSPAKIKEKLREEFMSKSKSKSLIRDSWTTLEIDKDGNVERVLIVSTKVILDPDDKDYNPEKIDRMIDEVKANLDRWDRAHIFNSDDA